MQWIRETNTVTGSQGGMLLRAVSCPQTNGGLQKIDSRGAMRTKRLTGSVGM